MGSEQSVTNHYLKDTYKYYCGNKKCSLYSKLAPSINFKGEEPRCSQCSNILCFLCRYCKDDRLVPVHRCSDHPCLLDYGWTVYWMHE